MSDISWFRIRQLTFLILVPELHSILSCIKTSLTAHDSLKYYNNFNQRITRVCIMRTMQILWMFLWYLSKPIRIDKKVVPSFKSLGPGLIEEVH